MWLVLMQFGLFVPCLNIYGESGLGLQCLGGCHLTATYFVLHKIWIVSQEHVEQVKELGLDDLRGWEVKDLFLFFFWQIWKF